MGMTTGPLAGFEPETPIDCKHCGGLYDLRFWWVLSDRLIQCGECKGISIIEDAVRLTEANTEAWSRETLG